MSNVIKTYIAPTKQTPTTSSGKCYNQECGIISLTSWKARINTVGLTLFNLYKQCPGFHIVLVLSEDEFPKKEAELPDTVMAFVDQDLIEILWVKRNYRSMKKCVFTMEKYPDVPVITADDDCLYTCNYAQNLYNAWNKHKDTIFRYVTHKGHDRKPQGPCTIYPPENICHLRKHVEPFIEYGISVGDDDAIGKVIYKHNLKIGCLGEPLPFVFHTTAGAMHKRQKHVPFYKGCFL